MRFEVVGHERPHQHSLRSEIHLRLHLSALVQTLLARLTNEQLARVELVAHRSAQLGRVRLALGNALLEHEIVGGLWVEILALGSGRRSRLCLGVLAQHQRRRQHRGGGHEHGKNSGKLMHE